MGTLDRTWRLYKESFNVLSADVEILLFPVMSAVAAITVAELQHGVERAGAAHKVRRQ